MSYFQGFQWTHIWSRFSLLCSSKGFGHALLYMWEWVNHYKNGFQQIVLNINKCKIGKSGSDFQSLKQHWLLSHVVANYFLASMGGLSAVRETHIETCRGGSSKGRKAECTGIKGLKAIMRGWRDVSVVKSIGCSSRGSVFDSQKPHDSTQLSVTPGPKDLAPPHRHTYRQKNKSKKQKVTI